MSEMCNEVEASCFCLRDKGHEGNHECTCGGEWGYDEDGNFRAERLPGGMKSHIRDRSDRARPKRPMNTRIWTFPLPRSGTIPSLCQILDLDFSRQHR